MKAIWASLIFLLAGNLLAQTQVITDMTGRKVTVPVVSKRIISLSNDGCVYMVTLAPQYLLGWNFPPNEAGKKYLGEGTFNKPRLGNLASHDVNFEAIVGLHPDLIILSDEDAVMNPDEIQAKVKIPTVKITTDLTKTAQVYQLLGQLTGERLRAQALADYATQTLEAAQVTKEKLKNLPRIYYAEGASGLQTDTGGNLHAQVIDVAGGHNVADVAEERTGSMVQVSLEQVLGWNPDMIIVGISRQGDIFSTITHDPRWASLDAVKNHRVFKMPGLPFNWFDRPPSPARLLAVKWVQYLAQGKTAKDQFMADVKAFYQLFYRYELGEKDLDELLKDAL